MQSQFINNSMSNSIIDLNNMIQLPLNTANKFQSNITKVNDSISQLLPSDQKSVLQASVLNNTRYKGKFVLAKRLSDINLQRHDNQQKCPPIQGSEKQKLEQQGLNNNSNQKRSSSNYTSMPNIQKPLITNQKQSTPHLSKLNEELEKAMKNNIFNVKDQNFNNQFVEYNQGPRFRDGKVVPYTIVGSPQLFTKYHNIEEQKNSIKDQVVNITRQPRKKNTFKYTEGPTSQSLLQRKNSQIQLNATSNYNAFNQLNLNQTTSENASEIRLNTNYQQKSSFKKSSTYAMNSSGINNMKKKYRNADFDEVSKEELIHEMNLALMRIKQNEEEQLKKENEMNFEQRMLLNREQRILEKYNNTVTQWVKDVSKLSNFSHRKPEESLMIKSDDYRKKIEIFNAFDSLRSDEQRFGQRIWYMMLRKNNVKSDNKIVNTNDILKNADNDQDLYLSKSNIRKFVNYTQQCDIAKLKDPQIFDPREQTQSDIFSNFMTVTVNNPYKPIEVVRKSVGEKRSLNLTNSNLNQTQSSYFVNTQTFLENKIQENIHLLKNRIVMPNDENMQDLIVQGKNLYEMESKALLSDGNPNNYKYEKLNVIKAANNQMLNNSNNNNIYKSAEKAGSVRESEKLSQQDLDDEIVYEKQYDVGELSKTGYYFFKDL